MLGLEIGGRGGGLHFYVFFCFACISCLCTDRNVPVERGILVRQERERPLQEVRGEVFQGRVSL